MSEFYPDHESGDFLSTVQGVCAWAFKQWTLECEGHDTPLLKDSHPTDRLCELCRGHLYPEKVRNSVQEVSDDQEMKKEVSNVQGVDEEKSLASIRDIVDTIVAERTKKMRKKHEREVCALRWELHNLKKKIHNLASDALEDEVCCEKPHYDSEEEYSDDY